MKEAASIVDKLLKIVEDIVGIDTDKIFEQLLILSSLIGTMQATLLAVRMSYSAQTLALQVAHNHERQLEDQVAHLKSQNAQLSEDVSALQSQNEALQTQLDNANATNAELAARVTELEQLNEALRLDFEDTSRAFLGMFQDAPESAHGVLMRTRKYISNGVQFNILMKMPESTEEHYMYYANAYRINAMLPPSTYSSNDWSAVTLGNYQISGLVEVTPISSLAMAVQVIHSHFPNLLTVRTT